MLLSYQECLEKYGTDYKIKKCVQKGELYVKEKGTASCQKDALIASTAVSFFHSLLNTTPKHQLFRSLAFLKIKNIKNILCLWFFRLFNFSNSILLLCNVCRIIVCSNNFDWTRQGTSQSSTLQRGKAPNWGRSISFQK